MDSLDVESQFVQMQNIDGTPLDNGFINGNFEPLRTYIYWTSHLQDIAKWIHQDRSANQDFTSNGISQNFGVYSQAPGGGSDLSALVGLRQTPYSAYMYSPQQERYRIGALNGLDGDGPTAIRCYEPHWEWNEYESEWVFRLAQPVIGQDAGYFANGNFIHQFGNEDILNDDNMGVIFENKYKFRVINATRVVEQ